MNDFTALIFKEFKRLTNKKEITLWILITILLALITLQHTNQHLQIPQKNKKFIKIQKTYLNRTHNYDRYGKDGVNIVYVSSANSILFCNTIIPTDLVSNINAIIKLDIQNNLKGHSTEPINLFLKLDFSLIVLLVFTLMALYYGWESLQNKEYLKFLSNNRKCLRLFTLIMTVRFILFAAAYLVSFGISMALISLKGVHFTSYDWTGLAGFLLVTVIMLLFFFQLGGLLSVVRFRKTSGKRIFVAWFLSVFVITYMIHSFVPGKALDINNHYQAELDKFETIINFEKKAKEIYGKFDKNKIEIARIVIENYWNNDFKQIQAIEKRLKELIKDYINRYRRTAILAPITFYILTGNEMSSRGYENYIQLYNYLLEMRRKFFRFWIDRVYYHDPRLLVSFIKTNENIFKGRSYLPENFLTGICINMGYCLILFIVSYFLFKRNFFHLSDKDISVLEDGAKIDLPKEKLKVFKTKSDHLNQFFFSILSGEKKAFIKKEMTSLSYLVQTVKYGKNSNQNTKNCFFYLCQHEHFPGELRVRDFISFYCHWERLPKDSRDSILSHDKLKKILQKTFNQLENQEGFDIILTLLLLKEHPFYLINDITAGMPINCSIELKEHMELLSKKGALIIFLTTTDMVDSYGNKSKRCFEDGTAWLEMVEVHKRKLKKM